MPRYGSRFIAVGVVAAVALIAGCGGDSSSSSADSSASGGTDSKTQVTTAAATKDGSAESSDGRQVDPCELFSDADVQAATGQQGLVPAAQRDSDRRDQSAAIPGTCAWSQPGRVNPVTPMTAGAEPAAVSITSLPSGLPDGAYEAPWDFYRDDERNEKFDGGPCDPGHAYVMHRDDPGIWLKCGVGLATIDVTLDGTQATAMKWLATVNDALK